MKYYNLTLFSKILYYEEPIAIEKDEDFESLLNNITHECLLSATSLIGLSGLIPTFEFKKEEITKEEYERLLASKDFI